MKIRGLVWDTAYFFLYINGSRRSYLRLGEVITFSPFSPLSPFSFATSRSPENMSNFNIQDSSDKHAIKLWAIWIQRGNLKIADIILCYRADNRWRNKSSTIRWRSFWQAFYKYKCWRHALGPSAVHIPLTAGKVFFVDSKIELQSMQLTDQWSSSAQNFLFKRFLID